MSRPAAPTLNAWATDDMVPLSDRTTRGADPSVVNPIRNSVELDAAANETVSFQVVVDAGPGGPEDLAVSWGPLADQDRTIASGNVQVFRMLPVPVTEYPPWYLRLVDGVPQPAGVYDALVSVDANAGAGKLTTPAGGRLALWVDVRVPREAVAGEYVDKFTVASAGGAAWNLTIQLHVHDFVLPDERPVAAIGGFGDLALFEAMIQRQGRPFLPPHLDRSHPDVVKGLVVMRQLMRLAHEHRLDLFDKQIHPLMKRDLGGQVALDWSDYDAIVQPYLNGTAFGDRLGCPAWPMPFSDAWPEARGYGGPDSPEYQDTVRQLLAQCRSHFRETQAAGQMFCWPLRTAGDANAYEAYVRLASLVRASDPEAPLLCQLPLSPPPASGYQVPAGLAALADLLAPSGEWFNADEGPAAPRQPLGGLWLSEGLPPYVPSLGVLAAPSDVRALPWLAFKYHCKGLFLPEVLNWSERPLASAAVGRTCLFYPGTLAGSQSVLPSVRLKRLRRGMEDMAYLQILRQKDRPQVIESVLNAVVHYAGLAAGGDNYLDARLDGWAHEGGVWRLARRVLTEEVALAVHGDQDTARRQLARRLAWEELNEKTVAVRVEQSRVSVSIVPAATATQPDLQTLQARVSLDLYNEHGKDAFVSAGFETLPAGWAARDGGASSGRIAANKQAHVDFLARGDVIPMRPNGKTLLPVTLMVDEQPRKIDVAMPILICGRANKAPMIDGRLDDWPIREDNCGADFVLLGRRSRPAGSLALRQTQAFVMNDRENLYIGIRCREPNVASMTVRADNRIRQEQLLACGEDLVEILLDPGGAASAPQDLYHLVVKPNGILIAERGIRTSPPLGTVAAWPTEAVVAATVGAREWVVEMSIPLSSFGAAGREPKWGVNFMRYASQGSESSSWAPAARCYYEPRNLGTMFLNDGKK